MPRAAAAVGQGPAAAAGSHRLWRILLQLPRIILAALVVVAIGDMIVGVFLRYVMVPITDALNLPPIRFFWVEETGEFSLAWLTLIGAGIGIADRAHFTLRLVTHRLPLQVQRAIHVVNHLIIVTFGVLTAWYGARLAESNLALTSPGLQVSLAWLYASAAIGGALIVLYGIAAAFTEFRDVGREVGDETAAAGAAGD